MKNIINNKKLINIDKDILKKIDTHIKMSNDNGMINYLEKCINDIIGVFKHLYNNNKNSEQYT